MRRKVLIVDDEPNLLAALTRTLRKEPYDILTATSGEEALSILAATDVDVVVSDQNMPGMSGTEFLRRVHQRYPDTIRFMLTGRATLEVAIEAINEGAISRFLTKPCNDVDLAVTIRQALQQKILMEKARQLLRKVREQQALLETLEEKVPGITRVKRDTQGVVLVEGGNAGSYEEILSEIESELAKNAETPQDLKRGFGSATADDER